MERKEIFTDETRERAHKLLDAGMEMLHEYVECGQFSKCAFCGCTRRHREFDEECPALLRCALTIAAGRNNIVEPVKGCGICGGRMTNVRGRYPNEPDRAVCPTCCAERLDQIRDISASGYGMAMRATVAPQGLIDAAGHLSSES